MKITTDYRCPRFAERPIGPGYPCFIVAEMGASHGQSLEVALELIALAAIAGADAIKFQHYTPDTLLGPGRDLVLKEGPWAHQSMRDLYARSMMPWEWTPRLIAEAQRQGIIWFSSVYDCSSVDFLEPFNPPAYKIASFEARDRVLLARVQQTGRPIIVSTGMMPNETDLWPLWWQSRPDTAILYCVSSYPARPDEVGLSDDLFLSAGPYWGFSDHTTSIGVPVAAVTLGACVIEKHLQLDSSSAPEHADQLFAIKATRFHEMVRAIRDAESARKPRVGDPEAASRALLRKPGGFRGDS